MASETVEPVQTLAEYKAERFAPPDEPKEEVIEPEIKAEEVEEGEDEPEKPKKGKLATRFSELTAARNAERTAREAAEARATAAEARAAELEAKTKPAAKIDTEVGPEPKPADYTDAFDYAKDLAKWSTDKALKDRDIADAKAKEEAKRNEILKAWQARLDVAKERIPDFAETLESSNLAVSDLVRDTIIESEYGPEILHYLSSDDAAAEKINGMTVKQALMHIAKLETKFEKPAETEKEERAEKQKAKLPEPIKTIKASNTSSNPVKDDGEFVGTYAQWKALRLKGKA